MSESDTRRRLARVERLIAELTDHVRRLEGERDRLRERLTDLEGAHDRCRQVTDQRPSFC